MSYNIQNISSAKEAFMQTIHYAVTGMTCNGCVARVKKILEQQADSVEVTLDPPTATLVNPKANFNALNEALRTVGNYVLMPQQVASTPQNLSASFSESSDLSQKSWFKTYRPLLTVFAYILLVSLAVEYANGGFILHRWMPNFMAGFFLVFSFFKMLDLAGFANSYAMYDLLAKKVHAYGFIYPFIELALGISYVLKWNPTFTNWLTLIVMGFSTIGVVFAVMKKQAIKCACLGTGFNLPMTTVTIIEDSLMVAMAAWMLI
jgi:copper chaperone CopZ